MVSKEILIQYADLQEEVKELRGQIDNLERQIEKIEKEGCVKDSVKGGLGGIQHFVVEGFPVPAIERKTSMLRNRQQMLNNREMRLLETLNEVEEFIDTVNDSYIRRIITARVIDGLTWQKVAEKMGKNSTEESIKKTFYRFLDKII